MVDTRYWVAVASRGREPGEIFVESIQRYRVYAGCMRIGTLAKECGVSVQALRFYEREQLLQEPERTASGYRIYDDSHKRRVRFIQRAKELGFTLAETRAFLALREQGNCPCADVKAVAEAHLAETRRKLQELKRFGRMLANTITEWEKQGTPKDAGNLICKLIER